MTDITVSQPQPESPAPVPPQRRFPRWVKVAVVAGAVVVVAGVVAGSTTFTMRGTINGSCYNTNISTGAEVTVYDATGDIIGHSRLAAPLHVGYKCEYPFEVSGLPYFGRTYSVDVGTITNRVTYDRTEASYPRLVTG